MTKTNFYVLIDNKNSAVLNHPAELPENWNNIHGLHALSDEELSNLEWAGHPDLGWVKFNSEFPFTHTFNESWLPFAKTSVKSEYGKQRWEAETKGILYKGIEIGTDDRTKTAILLKKALIANAPDKTFSWKHNNSITELTASDISNIADALEDYTQKCFDLEADLIKQIDAAETPADLAAFDLEIEWPSNSYNP